METSLIILGTGLGCYIFGMYHKTLIALEAKKLVEEAKATWNDDVNYLNQKMNGVHQDLHERMTDVEDTLTDIGDTLGKDMGVDKTPPVKVEPEIPQVTIAPESTTLGVAPVTNNGTLTAQAAPITTTLDPSINLTNIVTEG